MRHILIEIAHCGRKRWWRIENWIILLLTHNRKNQNKTKWKQISLLIMRQILIKIAHCGWKRWWRIEFWIILLLTHNEKNKTKWKQISLFIMRQILIEMSQCVLEEMMTKALLSQGSRSLWLSLSQLLRATLLLQYILLFRKRRSSLASSLFKLQTMQR